VVIPDHLYNTDILKLETKGKRQNHIASWQRFVNATIEDLVQVSGLNIPPLVPTVKTIKAEQEVKNKIKEEKTKQQSIKDYYRFDNDEDGPPKGPSQKETPEEKNRRIHMEEIERISPYDSFDVLHKTSDRSNEMLSHDHFVQRLKVVERVMGKNKVLVKRLNPFQKKLGIMNLKTLLMDHFEDLKVHTSEWSHVIFVICDKYGINEQHSLMYIPYNAQYSDFRRFVTTNLPRAAEALTAAHDRSKERWDKYYEELKYHDGGAAGTRPMGSRGTKR
jgi:hypothetical protein